MWNEVESGLRYGTIRGSGGGVTRDVMCKWWDVDSGGVLMWNVM